MTHNKSNLVLWACLAATLCVCPQARPALIEPNEAGHENAFRDEPAARALYEQMIEALRADGTPSGTLVGDGNDLWIYRHGDRPWFSIEDRQTYEKTRSNVYMTKPTPLARHSIGHEQWSNVTVDAEIPTEKFLRTPPQGWKQWSLPKPEDVLLKPGTERRCEDGGRQAERLTQYP